MDFSKPTFQPRFLKSCSKAESWDSNPNFQQWFSNRYTQIWVGFYFQLSNHDFEKRPGSIRICQNQPSNHGLKKDVSRLEFPDSNPTFQPWFLYRYTQISVGISGKYFILSNHDFEIRKGSIWICQNQLSHMFFF